MCTCPEPDVDRLAGEILRYLQTHRGASDTTEGIAKWWIKRQRLEDARSQVQSALDQLVAQSLVERQMTPAGSTLYLMRPEPPAASATSED